MTLQEAKLHLYADVNNDGEKEHGIFRMHGDPQVSEFHRTNYLLSNSLSKISSVISEFAGGESKRKGIYVDLGGGIHGFEIDFRGWEGATDDSGQDVTWGDPSYPSPSVENATGADPLTQSNILMNYLAVGEYDSRSQDAEFEYGEWSDEGILDKMDVVPIQQPQLTVDAREDGFVQGKLFLAAAQDLNDLGQSSSRKKG